MVIDESLKEARERSAAAAEQFRQKATELVQKVKSLPRLAVLEVSNGTNLIEVGQYSLFNYHKVTPEEVVLYVAEHDPDVVIVDGDDMDVLGALSDIAGTRATKVMVASKGVAETRVAYAKDYLKHIVFKPINNGELVDIISCMRPE